MANEIVKQQQPRTLQSIITSPAVLKKLNGCLGSEKKASAFASSVISVATGNSLLRDASPMSIIGAAMVAATLDLPVVPTLGEAYIIPYKSREGTKAQFQLGWKGLYQLCIRSGQFKFVTAEAVHEGELITANKFTGDYEFDPEKRKSDKVIGYMACFKLVNGFSKTIYWTMDEVKKHATRFSQAYRQGRNTPWITDFDAMACKTVLKALLNKYAPKSLEMENALRFDQSVVKTANDNDIKEDDLNIDSFEPEYVDNEQDITATQETTNPSSDLFGAKAEEDKDTKKEKKA